MCTGLASIYHYPCQLPDSAVGMVSIIFRIGIKDLAFGNCMKDFVLRTRPDMYSGINITAYYCTDSSIQFPISARHGTQALLQPTPKLLFVIIDESQANN